MKTDLQISLLATSGALAGVSTLKSRQSTADFLQPVFRTPSPQITGSCTK